MGIILLGGTIVNNAILMLDFILEARKQGVPKDEAIVQSVRLRLRPILMTAGSTLVGFSPLIFEMAVGLERMSPLGIAAGAGLLLGTVVTTVAMPVIYSALDSAGTATARLLRRKETAAATVAVLVISALTLVGLRPAASSAAELPSPLTLDQAVAFALDHNPDLHAAQARVTQLEEQARSQKAAQQLQVDLTGSGGWNQEKHGLVPGTAGEVQRLDRWAFQAGASAQYLVWDFGKTAAEVRSALARTDAGASDMTRRRQEVTFEVSRLFLDSLTVEDLADAARATRRSLEALLGSTERLVAEGRSPRVDVLKVRVRLAQVDSRLAALDAQEASLRAALAATLGLESELPPLAYAASPNVPVAAPALEDLPDAVGRRADVSARGREVAASEESVAAARRDFLPRLTLQASYNVYAAPNPEPVVPAGEDDPVEDDAFLGAQLRFPLFDGGLRTAALHQSQARLEVSRAALAAQRLQARREVLTALAEVESARFRVTANQTAVEEGQEALRVERLKYDAGKGVVNDVLDAEAALLEARGLLREASRQAEIAGLALDLALGRL